MRRHLIGIDLCLVGMAGALSILVVTFWRNFERPWLFLLYHALALAAVAMLAYACVRRGTWLWSLLRHWWPAYIVPSTFREMHFLIPAVHPRLYDAQLGALDAALFGDVRGAIEPILVPWFVDVMHLCYWSYFVTPFALGVALYRTRDPRPYRAAMTICMLGWYLSYLGYVAVPAIGPYAVEPEPIPQGGAVMHALHPKLLELEWRLPNAFPSGHVLVTLLCLACAWKWRRGLFWAAALPSAGLVLATIVLRYHYVVDVIASFALAPPIVWAGLKLHAMTERWHGSSRQPRANS